MPGPEGTKFCGGWPTALRVVNFTCHMGRSVALIHAWWRTGTCKLAPSSSHTNMDTMVVCGKLWPGPFGETMVLQALCQTFYACVQAHKLAKFDMAFAERVARWGVLGLTAAHARAHFVQGRYNAEWGDTSDAVQATRDEVSILLYGICFLFLLIFGGAVYNLQMRSHIKSNAWMVPPAFYTVPFLMFYFRLTQQNQYLVMHEVILVSLPWSEAFIGLGYRASFLVDSPEWRKRFNRFYYAFILMGLSQWVEHAWCEEFLFLEPHLWFDLFTFATMESAIACIMYELELCTLCEPEGLKNS